MCGETEQLQTKWLGFDSQVTDSLSVYVRNQCKCYEVKSQAGKRIQLHKLQTVIRGKVQEQECLDIILATGITDRWHHVLMRSVISHVAVVPL